MGFKAAESEIKHIYIYITPLLYLNKINKLQHLTKLRYHFTCLLMTINAMNIQVMSKVNIAVKESRLQV
jgi:hypothetical protein